MSETIQVRNSFDKETLRKIAKGVGITAFYAAAVFVLSLVQDASFSNAFLNALVVQLVPTILNSLKEWKKGQMPVIAPLGDNAGIS